MSEFDLVVRGGTIADGTGNAIFDGDVAISNGKIAQVGKVSGSGKEEIDAKGKLVTPGFVDIHTHYDGQITWADRMQPSSGHGVTTVVMGNCGVGFAPCKPDQHDLMIRVMEGVEDIPGIVLAEGIPWKWETFPEYMDFIGTRHADVDFAAQVPHAPVRVYVMGLRGASREPAMAGDIAKMSAIVKEGIEAGALGFSTSRSILHRLKDGQLAPTITVNEDELTGIARGLKESDKGVLQFIDDFNDAMEEASASLAMWRRLAEESGRPVSFNLAQNPFWEDGLSMHVLDYIAGANKDGLKMTAQVCNRPIGALFSLPSSTHPFAFSPTFKAMAGLSHAQRVAEMRKPDVRAKLLAETPSDPNMRLVEWVRDFDHMYPLGSPPDYSPKPEDSVGARARRQGADPLTFAYDLLMENDGTKILFFPITNFQKGNFDELYQVITHPNSVQGIADGGAHLGMICDASAPTHMLTHWTRDRKDGPKIPLAAAIRELTSATAAVVGLNDRGILKPGYKGDLNVIDYDNMRLHLPHVVSDLPAGGRRFMQKAEGYVATVLNGQVTYRGGEATKALPGRLIRGAQAAPAN
ncbi:MAG TPA: amidohydrolase family protein [Xanthobacteraceae bacterium]|nr:amidohydrolase family protein [Xanthobacteraceae bacterium]